jgi:uncharacterized protein
VIPGASRPEIAGVLCDRLKVRVAAPAEGGKANRAVIELLRERLGLAARDLEIVSGHSSRDKTVRIRGPADLIEEKLTADS